MQKRKMTTAGQNRSQFAAHILASLLCGTAAAAGLLCILAQVCCQVDIPSSMLVFVTTIAISLAMLPAGAALSMLRKEKGMLGGLLIGLVFFAVLWVIALAKGQADFSMLSAIKGVAMMASGAIGGYLGIRLRERRKRIH